MKTTVVSGRSVRTGNEDNGRVTTLRQDGASRRGEIATRRDPLKGGKLTMLSWATRSGCTFCDREKAFEGALDIGSTPVNRTVELQIKNNFLLRIEDGGYEGLRHRCREDLGLTMGLAWGFQRPFVGPERIRIDVYVIEHDIR
jgi:hypothetical protein